MAVERAASALGLAVPAGWDLVYVPDLHDDQGNPLAGRMNPTQMDDRHFVLHGRVEIGPTGLSSAGDLGSTLIHEFTHVDQLMLGLYSTTGNERGVYWPGNDKFLRNEIAAYKVEIGSAGITGISPAEVNELRVQVLIGAVDYGYGESGMIRHYRNIW
jgi:hypothetical protein